MRSYIFWMNTRMLTGRKSLYSCCRLFLNIGVTSASVSAPRNSNDAIDISIGFVNGSLITGELEQMGCYSITARGLFNIHF